MQLNEFLNRFEKVRRTRTGYKVLCPVHIEKTPSLIINQIIEDGISKIGLKCFGMNCSAYEIVDAVGLKMSDLFDTEKEDEMTAIIRKKDKGQEYKSIDEIVSKFKNVEDVYKYNKLDEDVSTIQIRYLDKEGDKQFATYHKEDESWYAGRPEGLVPLYNINEIQSKKYVVVVEGEKLVKILKEYGIPATTSLGGANNAEGADWTSLIGKSSVVIWRDYNEAGLRYQDSVDAILRRLNINLRKVNVEKLGLNHGDDLEQYIEMQTGTKDQIRDKIYSCIPKADNNISLTNPAVNFLKSHLDKIKKGEIKNWEVKFFPLLTKAVRMFKPGNQSVIVSAGGVGKSLFIGRTCDEFTLDGVARVKRLMLESPMSFHLSRSLAQQCKMTDVMNEEFHYQNPETSDQIINDYEDVLNKLGETITTSDSGSKKKITEWDAKGVAIWMEQNAPNSDLLVIDPVSIVLGDAPWVTSNMLTRKAEELMSKYPNLCIVWIQHTAESQSSGNIGGISGGKAWNRYTSTILEMIMLEDPEAFEIELLNKDKIIREVRTYIKVKKARNGAGNGWKIAIDLDPNDLTYKEVGRIVRKAK